MHARDVVLPVDPTDGEPPVLRLARQPVLENDHAGDDLGALQVGDVERLDPQRRIGKTQSVGDVRQRPAAGGEVTGPSRTVQGERLLGVVLDGLHQSPLVPAPGNPQVDPAATGDAEQFRDHVRVRRELRDEHLPRDLVRHPRAHPVWARGRAPGRTRVVGEVLLREELFDQLPRRQIFDLVHDPAALAPDPTVAYVEDLHGSFKLVLRERDDVGVGAVREYDRLLLHRPAQRADVVPQPGRAFVLLFGRGRAHLTLELADIAAGLTRHEVAEILDDAAVLGGVDPADARRRAPVDVAEQAGTADPSSLFEHPRAARTRRKDAQEQVEGLPDGPRVGVGTEVADAVALGTAHHLQARKLLVQRDGEARVALVVPVSDVEAGIELLDPRVLELKCFDLGRYDGPVHRTRGRHHVLGARVQVVDIGEVVRQPGAKVLRLAHVDHAAVLVEEPVHTRGLRNRSRRGTVGRRISHEPSLRRAGLPQNNAST